jgi:ribosomal-protein-alanine N-acetyltransferase
VIADVAVRLARPEDAPCIAAMSRDHIEAGLGWGWTSSRVLRALRDGRTNGVVAGPMHALHGFAIMRYHEDHAHLLLLAVDLAQRRRGIATAMIDWLEAVARTAGATHIRVECRRSNDAARGLYNQLGYHERAILRDAYAPRVDGIRLEKWLRPSNARAGAADRGAA